MSSPSVLQHLWHDRQDGHALLNTIIDAFLDKTQQLQDLMPRTQAQEQLLTELTELGATSQGPQKELAEDSFEQG